MRTVKENRKMNSDEQGRTSIPNLLPQTNVSVLRSSQSSFASEILGFSSLELRQWSGAARPSAGALRNRDG